MENVKIVKGQIFIIPNESDLLKNFCYPERVMEKIRRLCGVYTDYEDRMINVWIWSEDCNNWNDTYAGFQKCCGVGIPERRKDKTWDDWLMGYFPKYLPERLLQRKAEGDKITLYCKEYNVRIELTCNQLGSRYANHGKFEEVFDKVM